MFYASLREMASGREKRVRKREEVSFSLFLVVALFGRGVYPQGDSLSKP